MPNIMKLKRWGNSQGIILSKKVLKNMGINNPKNQEFYATIKGDELILKRKKSSRLIQNFGHIEKYKPQSGHREYEWGQSVGREL